MDSRRNFIGTFTGGLAGTLATPPGVLGANDRVRFGLVGAGARGIQLLRDLLACPRTECAAVADVYEARLRLAGRAAPGAKLTRDCRALLEGDLDAVVIATPQHLHAEHFIAAMNARKHVYLERAAALTVSDAKEMRAAFRRAGKPVVQIGHQHCSGGLMEDVRRFLDSGMVGQVTAIRAHNYRNTPRGKPQWRRPVYPDMTPETVDWQRFQGPAGARPFDAHRFVNWRYFEEYSGGNVHESMSQQLALWYRALNLDIPDSAHMTGGVYVWQDGREVPDTMSVAMEHRGRLLATWESGFGNAKLGVGEYALGSDGTLYRGQQVRYWPEKMNRPEGRETLGASRSEPRAHVQNFLNAVRGQARVNCPFETGYRVSVACAMAVESYRRESRVRWDREREAII